MNRKKERKKELFSFYNEKKKERKKERKKDFRSIMNWKKEKKKERMIFVL